MARKIKFALEMADGAKVRGSLEELREHFDLESAVRYFLSGKLVEWLDDRYYEKEAEALAAIDKDAPDLNKRLCEALGVEYEAEEDLDVAALERLNEKKSVLRQRTDNEEIVKNADKTALTQEDLADLLDMGEDVIYLCGEEFTVPARVKNKKYIGILGTPKVTINAKSQEELDAKGIVFENVVLPWGEEIQSDNTIPQEINEFQEKVSVPTVTMKQLNEIFSGVFENFQERYGNDVWDVIHLKQGEHCYEDFNETKKQIALNLICQGKYQEKDIVFIRVSTDFKAGWAFTKDSFCCGGSIGSAIIPYGEIIEIHQYWGSTDSNGIWIKTKEQEKYIPSARESVADARASFNDLVKELNGEITPETARQNSFLRDKPKYRIWCGKGGCENGDGVLIGFGDGNDMERIVSFLDIVKVLFNDK